MSDLKIPAGTTFDSNRAEYCISVMFDAAGKTGCNLLELQHALKSMKAVVDAELEVRLEDAGDKGRKRKNQAKLLTFSDLQ